MASAVTIDLRHVVRGLDLPLHQVQAVVELLDEGNTVPFITRYRKDRTGGLDEEQIRDIQSRLIRSRLLAERKQTILRSIESQGKLTEKLAKQIQAAGTTKRLEDLYLPFKPKKQTLATTARTRGLEPLAREILEADPLAVNLDVRAADFINPDKHVPTIADALLGAGHILAEQFSERAELRQRLREILQRSGKLFSTRVETEDKALGEVAASADVDVEIKDTESANVDVVPAEATQDSAEAVTQMADRAETGAPGCVVGAETVVVKEPGTDAEPLPAEAVQPGTASTAPAAGAEDASSVQDEPSGETVRAPHVAAYGHPDDTPTSDPVSTGATTSDTVSSNGPPLQPDSLLVEESAAALTDAAAVVSDEAMTVEPAAVPVEPATTVLPTTDKPPKPPRPARPSKAARQAKAERKAAKAEQKKKKEEQKHKAFSDYFDYSEEIKKIPPHRILAINRGERARYLRVKIEADLEAMYKAVDEMIVTPEHPHAEFLRGCARDALARLILPSLEREIRRELTEKAENHAVGVFARNLRNLLLQPPVRDRRVLAIDPGYKSGCKMVALDPFGNVLDHGVFFLIGKDERRQEAARKVVEMINRCELQVVVIGNGTGCRETEDFVAGLIGGELAGRGLAYVIVNEAGASVYSTSRVGREEFPQFDASVRGAISIGRRLQDPLSELVKIDPANIGVGLYQHDVKAKHLRASLDEVVESCVNYVGVDVNTASPALLRYVSGLNQLTARRLYEHRRQNGPFRDRQQFKDVPSVGEATFIQAAGFLKIVGGDNPLDTTWIHPESYDVSVRAMAKLQTQPSDLTSAETSGKVSERAKVVDLEQTAKELDVGLLTLKDILAQLARPGRDPREDLSPPLFKQGVLKLEDLTPGMELSGTILNVVDFGAFVDVGVHQSGLIHVSQLADKYIRDPHEVVAVGDIVKVWVMEVDKQRRRVSLTMIPPGTPRVHGRRPAKPEEGAAGRPPQAGPGQAQGASRPQGQQGQEGRPHRSQQRGGMGGQRPPRFGGGRPPRPGGPHGDQGQQAPPRRPPPPAKPRPKKPVVPLTPDMAAGKAPLRSFGDLAQFLELQQNALTRRATEQQPEQQSSPALEPPPPPAAAPEPPQPPS